MSMAPTQPIVAVRDSLAIQEALDNARTSARVAAAHDPYWAEFADLLDVEFWDGCFHYVLTGDDQDRIDAALDMEYGSPDRPGRSFLRSLPDV